MEVTSLSSGACSTIITAPTSESKQPTLPVAFNFSFRKMEAKMALHKKMLVLSKIKNIVQITGEYDVPYDNTQGTKRSDQDSGGKTVRAKIEDFTKSHFLNKFFNID
jgi:hypothetical protein